MVWARIKRITAGMRCIIRRTLNVTNITCVPTPFGALAQRYIYLLTVRTAVRSSYVVPGNAGSLQIYIEPMAHGAIYTTTAHTCDSIEELEHSTDGRSAADRGAEIPSPTGSVFIWT